MEAVFFLIAFLISAVVIGYLTRAVAKDKGHDGTDWFWGGFLLGPLGLLAAAGLSDRKLRNYIREIGDRQSDNNDDVKTLSTKNIDKKRVEKLLATKVISKEQLGESTISDIENSKEEFKKFLDERKKMKD